MSTIIDTDGISIFYDDNVSIKSVRMSAALTGTLTTTAAASDVVTIQGAKSSSFIQFTPTNASAAVDVGAGNVYVSAKGTNSVTISHSATSGMTFDIYAIN
jgi:hypothetical protein